MDVLVLNVVHLCVTCNWSNNLYTLHSLYFHRIVNLYCHQKLSRRCTSPMCQVALVTKSYIMAPNICGSSVWILLWVISVVPTIFTWLLDFLVNFSTPELMYCLIIQIIELEWTNEWQISVSIHKLPHRHVLK
jgi:hypothetical protein